MYDTTDYWENTEQVALKIRPCVFDGENSCSDSDDIKEFFENHTLRLSIKQYDDLGNPYWKEEFLPARGQAITLFIRDISTVNEDYYYLSGKAWLGFLGLDVYDDTGMESVQVVSKIINGHVPNPGQLLSEESVTIYLRQDPFQETIYISYSSILV